jgi:hypothetical protein
MKFRKTFQLPLPGLTRRVVAVVVEDYPPGDPRHANKGPEGVAGWYRAKMVFGKPGKTVIGEIADFEQLLASGESQISIACRPVQLQGSADIQDAKIFARESDGVITHAELRINASRFEDAADRSQQFLNRALSTLAIFSGQPIEIKLLAITEEQTESQMFTYIAVGGDTAFPLRWDTEPVLNLTRVSDQLLGAMATFKEGLNSFNPFYRFLSFFKVVEFCMARNKRDNRAKKPRPEMTIPSNPASISSVHRDDAPRLAEFSGKTFDQLMGEFKPLYRHAVAHLIPDTFELDPGDLVEMRKFDAKMPVIKYMAQEMLRARYEWEKTP